MLLLTLFAMVLNVTGIPITFKAVSFLEILFILSLGIPLLRKKTVDMGLRRWRNEQPPLVYPLIFGTGLVCLTAFWIGCMVPLSGYDTLFRWEFLARQILRYQTLAFYPPMGASDFRIYFYPDGFAPVVSVSYWWIYAAIGKALPGAVMPLVALQYVSVLCFAYHVGRYFSSSLAGRLTCGILASTPLFFRAVMIGQETGLTALALVGSTSVLLVNGEDDDSRALILSGLFAGLGALTREYGVALALPAFYLILSRRRGCKGVVIWFTLILLLFFSWYGRNWIRCGNPLYSLSLGLFPVNGVFESLMQYYRELLGFGNFTSSDWNNLFSELVSVATFPIVAGLPMALWQWRRNGWLLLSIFLPAGLWVLSVPYTSGGYIYSMRVLSPALVFLSVAAGTGIARVCQNYVWKQKAAAYAVAVLTLYGAFCGAIFPAGIGELDGVSPIEILMTRFDNPLADKRVGSLVGENFPPGSRLLAESAYAHSMFVNAGAPYDLVPIWSPEVKFLFDRGMPPEKQHGKLNELGIVGAVFYAESLNTRFIFENTTLYSNDASKWSKYAETENPVYIRAF